MANNSSIFPCTKGKLVNTNRNNITFYENTLETKFLNTVYYNDNNLIMFSTFCANQLASFNQPASSFLPSLWC